jgi:hypothetical protein
MAHDGRRPNDTTSSQGANLQVEATNWGTPRVTTNGGYPSPKCTGKGSRVEDQAEVSVSSLPDQTPTGRKSRSGSGRRLSPAFVSWLQGNPWWWTQPVQISFAASEIKSWRAKLARHLCCLLGEPESFL